MLNISVWRSRESGFMCLVEERIFIPRIYFLKLETFLPTHIK